MPEQRLEVKLVKQKGQLRMCAYILLCPIFFPMVASLILFLKKKKKFPICCEFFPNLSALQVSRGGQSVTLVGTTLVIFGGEDAKQTLLNDLHILDLETMTWDEIDAV